MTAVAPPAVVPADVVPKARGHAWRAAVLVVLLGALGLAVLLSVWLGFTDVSLWTALRVLVDHDGSEAAAVVRDTRLPRAALGVVVGVALGLSGAILQALTRNPLADPGLLGVQLGAATAVVIGIAFLGVTSVTGHIYLGFAGAAIATVVVYVLGATGRGVVTPDRLVLAGAAVTAVLVAFDSAVLLHDPLALNSFRFWQVGSLAGRRWEAFAPVAPFIAAGAVVALLMGRALNAIALGDETGRGLGANVGLIRGVGIVAVTVLCGAATAAAGPIVFVGLAVPHIARLLVGPDQRWLLPYSAVLGAILLVASDLIGRVVVAPSQLEVGIVTAVLGGPLFLALCLRRKLSPS